MTPFPDTDAPPGSELFGPDPTANLLPGDGIVNYYGPILSVKDADRYFAALLADVPWKSDEVVIFGKRIETARKVAWFGDSAYGYTYSGTTRHALPWNAELRALKQLIEQTSGAIYNSCLLNLYHDGSEGMSWHSDDEKELARDAAIASLSLGAERKFSFKHKRTSATTSVTLEHGALLVMRGTTQTHWLHSLPKSKKVTAPRINLTFRTITCL
ncbi:2OG-Fe(II) oxygenase [Chthoniobacter flavus Ellin428]|uniref:2OG-Fe(II) oxygenase n=1 Tax=Chthoniobacter flavus Ellin428 TaxID=497964 RepID=B4CYZ1_9BACT|nr:alpha-ketoglutarate-dependent dioxygenase AlkB [Chthoniobacter flavus]EDY20682.1 2OG-Fe(II) oxygenase [Chthoniobacter flavus Ellin428]TCO89581.1 alkylated DNA repair dioxygenase AlkB [Chthoniobacter flavus]